MSTTVTYKGNTIATVNNNTKTLKTAGQYMEDDLTLVDVSGGASAISVIDEPDSHGGTIRHINAVDLSNDTVTAAHLEYGYTAHDSQGEAITGELVPGGGGTPRTSSDLTVSGATVTAPAGVYASDASKSVATMTLPTTTSSSATSGYTSKATISRSTSDQYINIGTGYNSAGAYYKVNATPNGTVTAPASISGSSATVSTSTNTLTLTKTVSVTPSVSTAGYVSSGTAGNSSVSLSASVTTKAATTYHPSTSDQTISSGTYTTGAQTIKGVLLTNLSAGNIKKDVVVKIGDSTDDDCVTSITGTYEGGGGGGGGMQTDEAVGGLSSATTLVFTGLKGEPTSFSAMPDTTVSTGTPAKVAAIVFDGTTLHGQTITNTSNAQVTYDSSSFTKSYSNGTLTITSSGPNFVSGEHYLYYTYGGSSANIDTKDVQVGSGATSITFTGLEDEPDIWSVIFKSNFGTSSGYQRVIFARNNSLGVEGMEMDSMARNALHWSASYSNGSFTVTSNGTNQGGYFHQPGYYQLTYGFGGEASSYQKKTVTPSTTQQVITADEGYDALSQVTVEAMPTGTAGTPTASKGTVSNHSVTVTPSVTNSAGYITGGTKTGTGVSVSASELVSGSQTITSNGTVDVTNLSSVVVSVSGGTSMNTQTAQSTTRRNNTSLGSINSLTCKTTGTYDVYWTCARSNTSQTWGSQLYIGGNAYGSENTTWSNNVQNNHLTGVSISANSTVAVYGRSRSGYYIYAPQLTIVQTS